MTYPAVETFYSIQGEGLYSGSPAFFVRLFGCPVKCPWCDTRESWAGKPAFFLSAEEIAARASLSSCEFAVVTGGEPTVHPLEELVDAFHSQGIPVHLETSGYMPKNACFDWITLSPKIFSRTDVSYLEAADEMKFVVSSAEEIGDYIGAFGEYAASKRAVFITPEWGASRDAGLLEAVCEAVKLYGAPYRAGWQLHKCFAAR